MGCFDGALTDARLRLIASNYAVPAANWVPAEGIELVEDPVDLRAVRGSANSDGREMEIAKEGRRAIWGFSSTHNLRGLGVSPGKRVNVQQRPFAAG